MNGQGDQPGKGHHRRQRLAAALRDNLKRRKAQDRGRRHSAPETADQASETARPLSASHPAPRAQE